MKQRIANITILARCIVRALFCGSAKKVPQRPQKILVIQGAKLGDMVCTTPVFTAIKQKYLGAKVWVAGDAVNAALLKFHPQVDGYIVLNASNKNFGEFKKVLANEKFDVVVSVLPNFKAIAAAYLAGVRTIITPKVIGFSLLETKPYKVLSRFLLTKEHRVGSYAPQEYLNLLESLGIHSTDTTKTLYYSSEAEKKVADYLREHDLEKNNFVIIAPSVGNKIKLWDPKKFAEVALYIWKKYQLKVVVVGSARDEKEITGLFSSLLHVSEQNVDQDIINALNAFSIDELKAFISKAKIFIGVDTGPVYVAEAFGVPTIDIVGPMDDGEQPPQGPFNKIVKVERKQPAIHIMNARIYDEKEARRQIEEISVRMVTDTFDDLLRVVQRR